MDLSLGFQFCTIDLYFCLCASTILSWWLWLCSRSWSQAGLFLQFHSSFSRLEWQHFKMMVRMCDGLPWWLRRSRICLQFRRLGFDFCIRKIPLRRERQPTPVLLPGEFHGQRSLAGYCYSPWVHKESNTTKQLTHTQHTRVWSN